MHAVWKRLLQKINSICLVDRLLFLFMGMFYLYIGVHLLTGAISLDHAHPTDVIVRTSAAAIFGYFISANFSPSNTAARTISQTPEPQSLSKESPANLPLLQNKIGFQAKEKPTDSASRLSAQTGSTLDDCGQQQVVVVAVFGLISFFLLLFARHLPELSENLTAIISQLRDFVSASIGFLVSCKKKKA